MKNALIKAALMAAAFLPLLSESAYVLGAWRQSPLDSKNWIFVIAALVLAGGFCRRIAGWAEGRFDWRGVVLLSICSAGFVYGELRHIHAAVILSAVGMASASVLLIYGEKRFVGTLPLFGLLALGTPSTGYWSGYYFRLFSGMDVSGLILKLVTAVMLTGLFMAIRHPIKLHTVLFVLSAGVVVALVAMQFNPPRFGEPLKLRTDLTRIDDWVGVSETPSAQEKRFFRGCEVKRWVFFRENAPEDRISRLALLAVDLGGDVHKIHPTELCMRSSGREIVSNREKIVKTPRGSLAVQELRSESRDGETVYLTYVWYVGSLWSTGSFLTFRRWWRKGEDWRSYQLVVALTGDAAAASEDVDKFITAALPGGSDE